MRALTVALTLFSSLLFSSLPSAQTAYPKLTNTRREVVNFNVETVRGIAFAPDGSLLTINTHGSQLVLHSDLDGVPERIGQTVLNPVSLARWGTHRVVVAGAGTHALALHDLNTFDILDVLQLRSEPADIVIDPQTDTAFVSCQGDNVVLEVHLPSFTITDQFPIPSERPRFLFFDPGASPSAADNRVVVAAFLSGNGSTIVETPPVPGERSFIFDPAGMGLPQFSPPDNDLFRIDPNLTGAAAVTPVKRRVGTMLTAHGRHPDGTYWALNVNSLNADPSRQSEPLLRGDFVRNQAWLGAFGNPANFALDAEQTDLDFDPASGGYNAATSVAFPWGIAFAPAGDGRVYVSSPLDDCVSIRDAAGAEVGRFNLTAGSIPLDVELHPFSPDILLIYCWGRNEVLVQVVSTPTAVFPLSLGIDATPPPIKAGREIWYDGHRSLDARTSCNSCHPGGKSDFLGWQISDEPSDRKDVMITQSLLGIEDTFPYHWRGERALIDFNGAFVDLLGGPSKLTDDEFEAFQAFVFSLQNHANPREDVSRVLPNVVEVVSEGPGSTVVKGNPSKGVLPFTTVLGFNGQTCAECHLPQTGTNDDFIFEVGSDAPTVGVLETPHLRELRHKDQPRELLGGIFPRARSGFGIAHNGAALDLLAFTGMGVFNLTPTEAQDIAAFVRRFDQGIAPAAHATFMLDSTHATGGSIASILEGQAATTLRWIDVVAFGRFIDPATATSKFQRWMFNPSTGLYDCNDTNVVSQPLNFFIGQAALGQTAMAFLGVPPGNGFRFALDPDHDNLIDSKEVLSGTSMMNPDSDKDGQPDGYEVMLGSNPLDPTSLGVDTLPAVGTAALDFSTSALAKVEISANEDVSVSASFQHTGGPIHVTSSPVLGRLLTMSLQGLEPSTPASAPLGANVNTFSCTLTLTDRSNNSSTVVLNPFTSSDMLHPLGVLAPGSPLVIPSFTGTKASSGGAMTITGTINLSQRFFDPAGINATAVTNRCVVLQVVRETGVGTNLFAIDNTFTTTQGTIHPSLKVANLATPPVVRTISSGILPGPFLATLTPTGGAGTATFNATVSGLSNQQKVRVRVVAILEPHPDPTLPGVFIDTSIGLYHMPPTPIGNHGIELQYP